MATETDLAKGPFNSLLSSTATFEDMCSK